MTMEKAYINREIEEEPVSRTNTHSKQNDSSQETPRNTTMLALSGAVAIFVFFTAAALTAGDLQTAVIYSPFTILFSAGLADALKHKELSMSFE